jgi:hypothetical protein
MLRALTAYAKLNRLDRLALKLRLVCPPGALQLDSWNASIQQTVSARDGHKSSPLLQQDLAISNVMAANDGSQLLRLPLGRSCQRVRAGEEVTLEAFGRLPDDHSLRPSTPEESSATKELVISHALVVSLVYTLSNGTAKLLRIKKPLRISSVR